MKSDNCESNMAKEPINVLKGLEISKPKQRKSRLSPLQQENILRLHIQGFSNIAISRQIGCTTRSVRRYLERNSTPPGNYDLDRERENSINVYKEIQRLAWISVH